MKVKSGAIGLFFIALATMNAVFAQALDWRTYVNERFGSRIEYPAGIFSPEPPPENGDGRRFKARDGAGFTISAMYNVLSETLQSLENSLRHPEPGNPDDYGNVTYRISRGNMLVLSGVRGEMIYYEKFLFSKDRETIHHFSIVYPAGLREKYD